MKITYLLFACLLSNSIWSQEKDLGSWVKFQYQKSFENLTNNISRPDTLKGFVVASPSKRDPDYYYHWVRDAALVMESLRESLSFNQSNKLMRDYHRLVDRNQKVSKISGQGEPKFNPDGSSYKKDWGRPQNDGPALRVITLSKYAFELIKRNKIEYVRKFLYGGRIPARTVLKRDLEYVSHHWKNADYDLWEEVKGQHFYTRYVQRTALILGARLAQRLGDHDAASWYNKQARGIELSLRRHWSPERNYILSTLKRVGGLDYKKSNLDTSVILAVNHAHLKGLSFGALDDRVIATASRLITQFKRQYPINKNSKGVGMGRYPEDRYFGGHPWFLLTAGMAEYFYTVSKEISKLNQVEINPHNGLLFSKVYGQKLKYGKYKAAPFIKRLSRNFRNLGDEFLKKIQKHAHPNGQLDEQFDKKTGHMKSAVHLTWSYAAFMTAVNER